MQLELERLASSLWIAKTDLVGDVLLTDLTRDSRDFWTVSHSDAEVSIISSIETHPSFSRVEGPWAGFRIVGTLDFSQTGVLSHCSAVLAQANISTFAISTFDTDYFLVPWDDAEAAVDSWQKGGLRVHNLH
jgi:hypothetical protein